MEAAAGVVAYLDSSALVKLVTGEPETSQLREELALWPHRASSRLAEIEVHRAALRFGRAARRRAQQVLAGLSLIAIDDEVVAIAGAMLPETLRTLDAIHVATARILGTDLGVLITYDRRMHMAARTYNVPRLAPGRPTP